MAERRMLAKSIIESDAFSDMPVEAQMLYVRLNLAADDDGFVSNPRTIMRGCGASNDSMLLLINKKFILAFEKGDNFVYLIKHWRIHNFIRKDRHTASTFRELLRGVYYDENRAYSMSPGDRKIPVLSAGDYADGQPCDNQLSTNGQPTDNHAADMRQTDGRQSVDPGKDSIGKDIVSVGKVRSDKDKGEYEGDAAPVLAGPAREKRISEFKDQIERFRKHNYDPCSIVAMAAREGITREDLGL